jgi:MOSC domain-containing protein YiiM
MNKISGKVEAVFLTADKNSVERPSKIQQSIKSDFSGINGDGHSGQTLMTKGYREQEVFGLSRPDGKIEVANWRQWSAVSVENLKQIAEKMGLERVDVVELATLLGANLLVSGIEDFTKISAGSLIIFPSGCIWKVEAENFPCVNPGIEINKVYPKVKAAKFPKLAWNLRGLVGTVFKPGEIKTGDTFEVLQR